MIIQIIFANSPKHTETEAMYCVYPYILFIFAKFLMYFIADAPIKGTKKNIIDVGSMHNASH